MVQFYIQKTGQQWKRKKIYGTVAKRTSSTALNKNKSRLRYNENGNYALYTSEASNTHAMWWKAQGII